jgi:hypothetical protein
MRAGQQRRCTNKTMPMHSQLRMISYGQHSHQASTRGAQSLAPSLMCAACSCMAQEGRRNWQTVLQGSMQVQEELDIPRLFYSRAGGIMGMCGSECSGWRLEASEVDHPWRYCWSRSALRYTFSCTSCGRHFVACISISSRCSTVASSMSVTHRSSQRTCLCATVLRLPERDSICDPDRN